MNIRTSSIIALLYSCCVLSFIAFAMFTWHSYRQNHFAEVELGKLGGTFTVRSAARLRDTGSPPSFFEELMIANPTTEVNLSMTSWPREKETFPLVTDNDLGVIAGLTHVQRLTLRGMPISDAAIKQLARLKNLKRLDVRETQFSAEGLSRLKEAMPSCEVVADDAD